MSTEVSQVRIGTCYRTRSSELRQVRAIENDMVSYVVVVHTARETSVGPMERVTLSRFVMDLVVDEPCP
jgi:hypothetical protein